MPELQVPLPDIGEFDEVDVVEVLVAVGDTVAVDDPLITLESDKASMEIPAPAAGTIKALHVAEGDAIGPDKIIAVLDTDEAAASAPAEAAPAMSAPAEAAPEAMPAAVSAPAPVPAPAPTPAPSAKASVDQAAFDSAYASPSVRRLARELGVDLGRVGGTGRKGRVTGDDLRAWVQQALQTGGGSGGDGVGGFDWPQMPAIDFTKFGEVEEKKLARIRRVSAQNLHRSWLHVPHVTQHEDADVTELEAFRKAESPAAKERGVKLTPVAFLLKACAVALLEFPDFNSSLHPSGESLIVKKYVHIGVAVDTPNGLVVPVIRDVDKKGVYQLATEVVDAAARARDGKLTPADFQGGCFSISSLGGIGGTKFTPIVNAPEVAILGASRNVVKPVWNGSEFEPRTILPLSLSYDHRVIDGASAARFVVYLAGVLGDIRKLIL
ncbi:MAG: dihydrolipoyllysine-residue acetyltransferase [Acidobacteriota bacterium]